MIPDPGGYFRLDRTTGRLTTVRELDREALINGLITIQVAVSDVYQLLSTFDLFHEVITNLKPFLCDR